MSKLTEHESTIVELLLAADLDGGLALVVNYSVRGRVECFSCADVAGRWLASFLDAVCPGALVVGNFRETKCRVRLDEKLNLVGVGRIDGTHWFEFGEPAGSPEPSEKRWEGWTPDGARALRYLNNKRAKVGRHALVPVEAGYTNDDIIADALHYRWPG